MVMPPCGGFDYSAVVPAGEHSDPWYAQERTGKPRKLTENPLVDDWLVGPGPKIEFSGSRITLAASGKERAQVSVVSFEVDVRLISALRPNDVLYLARTASGGLGVSVVRNDLLVVAAGAVMAVPLGKDIAAKSAWDLAEEAAAIFKRRDPSFEFGSIPVEVTISGQTRLLQSGSRLEIAGYYIEVANTFLEGVPGTDACLSITLIDSCPKAACVLSARLLGRNAGLNMVQW